MDENVLVSICCITYNHEKYIRDALDGFLMQKTNFKYEIIIHDDASTDKTQDIIKEYEQKYPDIIKPIYQKENQYKKGKKTSSIAFEKAVGKYIALCEGDDYWINESKLQMQVDYMEKHPNCTFCFHNAKEFFMEENRMTIYIDKNAPYGKYIRKDGIYSPDQVMLIGYNGRIPTASFVFRTECIRNLPDWYYTSICGDMPLKLIITSYGYAHYIDKEMSVYRRQTGTSITDKWKKEKEVTEKKIKHIEEFIEILENFNKFSDFKYSDGIEKIIKYYHVEILCEKKEYKKILKSNLKGYYKDLYNDKYLIKYKIKKYCPIIYKIYLKVKGIRNVNK